MIPQQISIKERYAFIDVLKGLAILGVVLVHFMQKVPCPNGIVSVISSIGARCPQLFFVSSAFLASKTLSNNAMGGGYMFYIKSRYKRLAPLYYTSLALMVAIPPLSLSEIFSVDFMAHLLFLHGLNPTWINSFINVEWYIADLALFYFTAPIIFKFVKGVKSSIVFLFISVVIAIVFTLITNRVFETMITENALYEMYFHTVCFINQLPVMSIGIVLYFLFEYSKKHVVQWGKLLVSATICIFVVTVIFVILGLNKRVLSSSLIAGLVSGLLFMACYIATNKGFVKFEKFRALSELGKESFGIYCLHMVLLFWSMHYVSLLNLSANIVFWIGGFVTLVIFSYLIGKLFSVIYAKTI